MVRNFVLQRHTSRTIKCNLRPQYRRFTSPNDNFQKSYPHSNALFHIFTFEFLTVNGRMLHCTCTQYCTTVTNFWALDLKTSSPKGNNRSPESNVPRSHLISKTYKWAMETRGPKSSSSKLLCLSWLPATLMMIQSKTNKLAWRHHFPITSL